MSDADFREQFGLDDIEIVEAADPLTAAVIRENASLTTDAKRAKQEEILRMRKNAFSRMFRDGGATKDDIAIVMPVLERFCRWRTSTFNADPRMHALAEGRREVLLTIHDYCELSMDALFNKLA